MSELQDFEALRERVVRAEQKAENLSVALRIADEENAVLREKLAAIRKILEDAP